MRKSVQGENLAMRAKVTLLQRGQSIASLARKLRYSRTAVSMAINHGMYAGVLADVMKELGL